MKASRSKKARRDLTEILRYVAQQSQSWTVVSRLLEHFDDRIRQGGRNPEMGQLRLELGEDVRAITCGSYVIYNRSQKSGVLILRILHGSRNIDEAWKD
jgi:toxin ParE1/3/4